MRLLVESDVEYHPTWDVACRLSEINKAGLSWRNLKLNVKLRTLLLGPDSFMRSAKNIFVDLIYKYAARDRENERSRTSKKN